MSERNEKILEMFKNFMNISSDEEIRDVFSEAEKRACNSGSLKEYFDSFEDAFGYG